MRTLRVGFFLLLTLVFCNQQGKTQAHDSLQKVWENIKLPDSTRLLALSIISWDYLHTNPDSAFLLATDIQDYAKLKKLKFWEANALNTMGAVYYIKGEYPKALTYYFKSVKIKQKIGDKRSLAKSLNNIGLTLQEQGSYAESLRYYYKSLRIKEQLKDEQGIAVSYSNIGMIYQFQKRFTKALDFHFKSLALEQKLNNQTGIADCYNNIGVVYDDKRDNVNAMKYFLKALAIREKLGDKTGLADSYTNIGFMFSQQTPAELKKVGMAALDRFGKALEYYNRALKIYQEMGEEKGVAVVYSNIGKLENQRKNFSSGVNWCKRSFDISGKIGAMSQQVEACACIYEGYKGMKDGLMALSYMEKYMGLRDTLINSEQEKKIILNEFQYEYDKKSTSDSIMHAEAARRKDLEISRQKAIAEEQKAVADKERIQKYMLWGGVTLILLFSIFIYNRLRIIRKQNVIIELQKKEVDEKNRDITDSISYAQRIQEAMLPEPQRLKQAFSDAFVLFRPRDMVSGDFYWYSDNKDVRYLCVADCTGHGVPGALMSMMGTEILNSILLAGLTKTPGETLSLTDEYLRYALTRRGHHNADGMDMVMVAWHPEKKIIEFAGANRPLLLIRNNEIHLTPGSHAGIGGTDDKKIFPTTEIKVQPGDCFYLYTDGFHDQFGGDKNKKFMSKNFQQLLCKLAVFPMDEQRQKLDTVFDDWKGKFEQIDDVCVVGFKI